MKKVFIMLLLFVLTIDISAQKPTNASINGHDYVDFGLPSGTLWATCNVGAISPEQYGYYFAWGQTIPNITYTWVTYKYANGNYDQLTKYCNDSYYGYKGFIDKLTRLEACDDAATANWGGKWKTPTRAQWQELLDNTENYWTSFKGVYGRVFYANGKSIFLPAAGRCWYARFGYDGEVGSYWSASLGTDTPYEACYFLFYTLNCSISNNPRHSGISVRPVHSSRK